jgi:hypothetical protein
MKMDDFNDGRKYLRVKEAVKKYCNENNIGYFPLSDNQWSAVIIKINGAAETAHNRTVNVSQLKWSVVLRRAFLRSHFASHTDKTMPKNLSKQPCTKTRTRNSILPSRVRFIVIF